MLAGDFVVRLETRDLTGLVNAAEGITFHSKITHHLVSVSAFYFHIFSS